MHDPVNRNPGGIQNCGCSRSCAMFAVNFGLVSTDQLKFLSSLLLYFVYNNCGQYSNHISSHEVKYLLGFLKRAICFGFKTARIFLKYLTGHVDLPALLNIFGSIAFVNCFICKPALIIFRAFANCHCHIFDAINLHLFQS